MEWDRQWIKPQILTPEGISKLDPNSCYRVSLHVLAALWKDMGQLVHGKRSVNFSIFCHMPTAWQCLGWKHGKQGHQVKCNKDKSYWPGIRLIPSCKLQTHTLKNSLENPEKLWNRNIRRTHDEQRCHSITLHSLYWSQAPYQIPYVQNSGFRLLHITAFHGRTVVVLCLGSGCFAFTNKGLCGFLFGFCLFVLNCEGTVKWCVKGILCALLQQWHMTPHWDFDFTTLLFSLWYWCIYSKN